MSISKERLSAIKNEIKMAEVFNEEELRPLVESAIKQYTGEYLPPIGGDWDVVLNEVYPVIQNNLPSIFFRNPRAFLKPRNKTFIAKRRDPVSGQMVEVQLDSTKSARTQENILNYSLVEMKYKKEVQKVLLDALLFPYGVLWHGYKGEFGMTEEKSLYIKKDRVFVKRISPLKFIHDPAVSVSNIEEGDWVGRVIDVKLRDLVEDDKLDVDKNIIKGFLGYGDKVGGSQGWLKQSGGQDKLTINPGRSLIDYTSKEYKNSKDARFVKVYEIFLRPTKKEKSENKKGWILLLTDEQEKPLRVSDLSIKAEGFPPQILEFNPVPDTMLGLADVETYIDVANQKNAIVNLQLRNAQENSKVWVGIAKGGTSEEELEHIQKGDQSIILFDGDTVQNRMFVSSPGGAASSELYLIDQRIQKNLEDKSGVTDLKRGFLQSGEESAASVKIRAAGGGARSAYRQDIMADFLKESLLYLNQLNRQFMPFDEAVRIVGSLDIEWSDKPSKEEVQADVDAEIDVISMLPENPEKEIRELNTILMLMIEGIRDPAISQKIAQEGKTVNLAPLIEQILLRMRIRDPNIFRNTEPKESQGYVSAQQMREAQQNVDAALHGTQVPFPPKPEDDHVAKLEIYSSIAKILEEVQQTSDVLNQLIQIHMALLQELQKKNETPGQVLKLKPPTMETF